MNAYLMVWDPTTWDWGDLPHVIKRVSSGKPMQRPWAAGSAHDLQPGDKLYFFYTGAGKQGIFATGRVLRRPYKEAGLDIEGGESHHPVSVTSVEFEMVVNPETEFLIPAEILEDSVYSDIDWGSTWSGIEIPEQVSNRLDDLIVLAEKPKNGATVKNSKSEIPVQRESNVVNEAKKKTVEVDNVRLAIVISYFHMLSHAVFGNIISDKTILEKFGARLGNLTRTKLVHYYGQISGLLLELGLPALDDIEPKTGSSVRLQDALAHFLSTHPTQLAKIYKSAMEKEVKLPIAINDFRVHLKKAPDKDSCLDIKISENLKKVKLPVDCIAEEINNENLRKKAIEFILEFEAVRLLQAGKKELILEIEVMDIALLEHDFDIRSFNEDGTVRNILIKPTYFGQHSTIILFSNELDAIRKSEEPYYIYRPYNLAFETKMFILKETVSGNFMLNDAERTTGMGELSLLNINFGTPDHYMRGDVEKVGFKCTA